MTVEKAALARYKVAPSTDPDHAHLSSRGRLLNHMPVEKTTPPAASDLRERASKLLDAWSAMGGHPWVTYRDRLVDVIVEALAAIRAEAKAEGERIGYALAIGKLYAKGNRTAKENGDLQAHDGG